MPGKSKKISPSLVGANVIGGTVGLVLGVAVVLFAVVLPIILFATYYYTLDLVKGMESNPDCQGCISGDYMCNKVLRHTPLPLMVIMVLNIVINLFRLPVPRLVKKLVVLINFVMYVWFVGCLFKNTRTLSHDSCPCVSGNEVVIRRLRLVSNVLGGLLAFSLLAFVVGLITMVLRR